MKLGDVVKLKNFTLTRTMIDISTGEIVAVHNNNQYNNTLAMITRIIDDRTYMIDLLPQYRSKINTDDGWRVKDLEVNYHNLEVMKTGLSMEVE